MNGPPLEVEGLRVAFKQGEVVAGVSFEVNGGERFGIVGESGSGKSTTALACLRLLPPGGGIVGGAIRVDGRSLSDMDPRTLQGVRGREIAMVFQDPMTSLNPVQSVGRQLAEAIRLHRPVSKAKAHEEARTLLERVRLPDPVSRLRAYPHELSGGMRQRVMIAMALANKPKVLLCDEPTTALDVTTQAQILDLLDDLCRDEGTAVLLISHDLALVGGFCDRIAVMYAGRIVETGPSAAVLRDPTHPYTAGLLASVPPLDRKLATLAALPGEPPDPRASTAACPFAPRCPRAQSLCTEKAPRLVPITTARTAACHFPLLERAA